jgi:hypothetical protein
MSIIIKSGNSGYLANVNNSGSLQVGLAKDTSNAGYIAIMSENDNGSITGNPYLLSPETDDDFRLRVSQDTVLDDELFNYTAQNTGKHTILAAAVNLAPSWTAGGYNTNPTNVVTITSGATLQSYAMFSVYGTGTVSLDMEIAFTALPVSNTIIDFGLFTGAITNPFAPTDGAYFRLNSSGLQGVVNYNGTELSTGVFPLANGAGTWTYTPNTKYQFILYSTVREVEFWVGSAAGVFLLGTIETPAGQGTPYLSTSQPFHIRHAIVGGAAGAALNCILSRYSIRLGGVTGGTTLSDISNRALGSYQGLSGGTLGQLIAGTVTSGTLVKPTAAVPANTSLVANLPGSLGGRIYETLTTGLAANVDAIFASYQVPAGTTAIQGRRLKVLGVKLSGMVSTVVVGGPAFTEWYVAFGHTAASLATAEAATTKAPRRVMLPELTTNMGAAAAAGTLLVQPSYSAVFQNPIYVNPGEFIALVGNKTITTAITSGILAYTFQFDYTWE